MMALNNLGRLLEMTGPKDMTEAEALYRRVLDADPRCWRERQRECWGRGRGVSSVVGIGGRGEGREEEN
jgi:hypothetical protein